MPTKPITGYDEAWDLLDERIGRVKSRYTGPAEKTKGKRRRILVGSDPHNPFIDVEACGQFFQQPADLAVLAGDLCDNFSISRFVRYEYCPIETELAATTAFLERASQTWGDVLIVEGNHDKGRFEKQLRSRLDDNLMKLIEFLSGGSLSILRALASRYPNVKVAQTKVDRFTLDWLAQVGDTVITHAEKFSIVPGGALRKIEDWLLDQERNLHLSPWRVVVQAHTHGLAWIPFHADKLLVESGCLCATQGYQLSARIGGRPQRNGWVTLEQVNGVTDRDSVKCHWPERQERAA